MASQKFSPSLAGEALPHWQMEYEGALQETDHKILFKRIEIAEAAILSRREACCKVPTVTVNGRKSRRRWIDCAA